MKCFRVDRIEEEFLVCISEDDGVVNIPLDKLPAGVGEGWLVTVSEDGDTPVYTAKEPCEDATKQKRERLHKLFGKNS